MSAANCSAISMAERLISTTRSLWNVYWSRHFGFLDDRRSKMIMETAFHGWLHLWNICKHLQHNNPLNRFSFALPASAYGEYVSIFTFLFALYLYCLRFVIYFPEQFLQSPFSFLCSSSGRSYQNLLRFLRSILQHHSSMIFPKRTKRRQSDDFSKYW